MSLLGWLGNIFIVVGLWKIGDKWRHAFLFSVVGELCWILKSLWTGTWDLASICIVFAALAAVNWYKWGRTPQPQAPSITIADAYKRLRVFLKPPVSIAIQVETWDHGHTGQSTTRFNVWDGVTHFYGNTLLETVEACERHHAIHKTAPESAEPFVQ